MKNSQRFLDARMGRNFDDFPGFQPFRSWANTYAQDCSTSSWGHSDPSSVKPRQNHTLPLFAQFVTKNPGGKVSSGVFCLRLGAKNWCKLV